MSRTQFSSFPELYNYIILDRLNLIACNRDGKIPSCPVFFYTIICTGKLSGWMLRPSDLEKFPKRCRNFISKSRRPFPSKAGGYFGGRKERFFIVWGEILTIERNGHCQRGWGRNGDVSEILFIERK